MKLEDEMLEKAIELLGERFGGESGCVAVIRIETGEYLTGVYSEAICAGADLCAETEAICGAHRLNKKITHSVCIYREKDAKNISILSPCGICQERLRFFGKDVQVAISAKDGKVVFKTLDELQPYFWEFGK